MVWFSFWKFIGTEDLGAELILEVGVGFFGVAGSPKTTQTHVSDWGRRAETWPDKVNGLFYSGISP